MTKFKTIRHSIAVVPFLILLTTLSIVVNCGNQDPSEMPSSDAAKGSIIFSLTFEDGASDHFSRTAPGDDICDTYDIDTITAAIMDAKNNKIVSKSWPCDLHAGTLHNIPVSTGLSLIVEALVSEERLWRAQVTDIEIIPSQTIDVGKITLAYIGEENQPPVADAGPDQTVNESTYVTLSGINSIDADDGIASFEWYQTDGMEVIFSTPYEPETLFLAPEVDICGTSLTFELAVTDFADATSVDDCIVNVTSENQNEPPNANAGEDQTVDEGTDEVYLDASNSTDPDDNIASYEWKQQLHDGDPEVILSDYYSPTPSFQTPDVSIEGATMTFEVTVTDACGLQDTDTCIVNITWVNEPPVAVAKVLPDDNVVSGEEVTLDGSQSSDQDSNITSYRWVQTEGVPVEFDSTGQITTFTAPDVWNKDPLLEFRLTVQDSDGGKGSDTCQVHVTPGPDTTPPIVTIQEPSEQDEIELPWYYGDEIDLSGIVTDNRADDKKDINSVEWTSSAGDSGNEKTTYSNGTFYWSINDIELADGENIIEVKAIDSSGNQGADTIIVHYNGWW